MLSFFLLLDDATRVKLMIKDGMSGSDYINASFIDVSLFHFFSFVLCLLEYIYIYIYHEKVIHIFSIVVTNVEYQRLLNVCKASINRKCIYMYIS